MIGHLVVLRPRSLLETGDLALVMGQRYVRYFVRLLPWVILPAIGCWALHALLGVPPYAALALQFALTSVTGGVYTILCGDLMLAPTTSLRDVQKRFLQSLSRFVWARLVGLVVVVCTVLLAFRFVAFLPEASLLERGTARAALSRSGVLLRPTPGRALALGVILVALFVLGAGGMELTRFSFLVLFGLPHKALPDIEAHLTWAPFLGAALVQPYLAALRFLLYIDCRTRREGWDLQVQFGALVTASESALRHTHTEEAA